MNNIKTFTKISFLTNLVFQADDDVKVEVIAV